MSVGAISLASRPSILSLFPFPFFFPSPISAVPLYIPPLLSPSRLPLLSLSFLFPSFLSLPFPINPDGVWGGGTVSSAQARPPNDFWCIVTLKLRRFPLAYWSVLFYFADFIRRPWGEKQWRRATGFFWLRGDRPHRPSGVGADDNRMT